MNRIENYGTMFFPTLLKQVLLLTCLLSTSFLFAQDNNDCSSAEVICSDENIALNPTGPGNDDFANGNNQDGCLNGENQSSWYYFEIRDDAPPGSLLGFTLTPDLGFGQDYDFAIFGPNVDCNNLGSPIRCSYAAGFCTFCPLTGLGMGTTDVSEPPSGDGFVSMLPVNPGDGFYLLIDNFSNNSTGFSMAWTGPAAPYLNCVDCEADAGTISAFPNPACPGSTVTFNVSGYNMDPDYTQMLIITDLSGTIIGITFGDSGTFSSATCDNYIVYSYNYETAGGSTIPMVGMSIGALDCSVECCDLTNIDISFEDDENPVFANPPPNMNLSCVDDVPPMTNLNWTDNCDGAGAVPGMESGSADLCSGGTITRQWTYTDQCNNTATHTQTITVQPAPVAMFQNPPANMTVSCNNAPTGPAPSLSYTNNGTGSCDFSGTVPAVQSGSADICGGTITYTWEATDPCGRMITHVQTITVEPAPEASFVNPPANMTVSCANAPTAPPPSLSYTNGASGSCAITGSAAPVQSGSADICGGTITNTWTFTDACGRTINHVQTITVEPAPEASFVNPPGNMTVSCANAPTAPPPSLSYTNGASGSCAITGTVAPVQSGSADICGGTITNTWNFTDVCGRTINHVQTITVDPAPEANFINPPASMTVSCANAPTGPGPMLSYTNNQAGTCEISGTVAPVQSGSADACGGTITYTWQVTDPCGRTINHVQNITVDPAPVAAFINPPANMTVSCANAPTAPPPPLSYSNGANGSCEIAGSVAAVESGVFGICGNSINYTWTFTDDCGRTITHVQTISIDPAPEAAFTSLPASFTVSCSDIPAGPAPDLTYTNGSTGNCAIQGTVAPVTVENYTVCGGNITHTWTHTDDCGRTINHVQTITIQQVPAAVFVNPPADATFDCDNLPSGSANALSYTNGETGSCAIQGTVAPIQNGAFDACGGTLTNDWSFTDICGRTISHQQNLVVVPGAVPTFIDPPANITVNCGEVPPGVLIPLTYSNNLTNGCALSGQVDPVIISGVDECGGDLVIRWEVVTPCGDVVNHDRIITVLPAPDPILIDPPADATIGCNEAFPDAPTLSYDNGATGDCEVSGEITPQTIIVSDVERVYRWEYTNNCTGALLFHIQTITQDEALEISLMPDNTSICENTTFDLSSVEVTAVGGGDLTVTFHSATPADASNELSSSIVSPLGDSTYYILAMDDGGCADEAPFSISIEAAPNAGLDGSGEVCFEDANSVDISVLLNGTPDPGGSWEDPNGTGVNLLDPTDVDLSILTSGTYTFLYIVPSVDICLPDTAVVTINLLPPVEFDILNLSCTADLMGYDVFIDGGDLIITTMGGGTLNDLGGGQYSVTGIPIANSLVVTGTNPNNMNCMAEVTISPPDCNCPNVDPPVSNGPFAVCEGEMTPELSVTVLAGQTANWYTVPAGGTPFLSGSLTYTPSETAVGLYEYYVEAEVLADGCVSALRTLVSLEINANPAGNNAELITCDTDQDGLTTFDLTLINTVINNEAGLSFTYYGSLADAMAGEDPLPANYANVTPFSELVFVVIENSDGCTTIVELTLTINLPPVIAFDLANEGCLDAEDGSITVTSPLGASYSLDGINFTNETNFSGLTPGDYMLHVENADGCMDSSAFTIAEGLELSLEDFAVNCDNAGTSSDPDDDVYTITFTVNNSLGVAGTYTVNDGTDDWGSFPYAELQTFTLPADGQTFTLTFTDDSLSCSIEQVVPELTPCSSDCLLSLDQFDISCSDNGTDEDPSDDFYTVMASVSALNGSVANTFTVTVGANNIGTYTYGDVISFDLPADGSSPIIRFADSESSFCLIDQPVGPLNACSGGCTLVEEVTNVICNDNGTPTDPSDDTFTFELTITGTNVNASTGWSSTPGGIGGLYGELVLFGPFPVSGGDISLTITDNENAACPLIVDVVAPATCSDECVVDITALQATCNDNGTIADETDDFYDVVIDAAAINVAGTDSFNLVIDGIDFGNFAYSDGASITLPADGASPLIEVFDQLQDTCFASQMIGPLVPCNGACTITAVAANAICSSNGTNDPSDDTFTVEVTVTGENTSAGWQVEDSTVVHPYGVAVVLGPFLISEGLVSFNVVDAQNVACLDFVEIPAPPSCSPDCSLSASTSTPVCNDNGTNDPSDDTFTFELTVTGENTSGGWSVDGNTDVYAYDVPVTFGPYPIAGGAVNLIVADTLDDSCSDAIVMAPPASCSPVCGLNIVALNTSCNDNGTVSQADDDFYQFTLSVEVENSGLANQYEVLVDGNPIGTFNYGVDATFDLPADGSAPLIEVRDVGEIGCTDSQMSPTLLPCAEECMLQVSLTAVSCNDMGTSADPSDDTFTFEMIVNGQNTSGQWQTTDGSLSGTYGVVVTAGPFPIAAGNIELIIQDVQNPDCQSAIALAPPPPCSFCPQEIVASSGGDLNCEITSTTLQGSSSEEGIFQWWLGEQLISTELNTSVTQAGVYTLIGTYDGGCTASDTAMIASDSEPPAISSIEVLPELCAGQNNGNIFLQPLTGGRPPYEFSLDGEVVSNSGFYNNLTPGDHLLEVVDANGCRLDTVLNIAPGVEMSVELPVLLELDQGDSEQVRAFVNVPVEELFSVQWSPPEDLSCDTCLVTTINAQNSLTYVIDVTHLNGCRASAALQLLARESLDIYIPNAFSPNGDGNNDIFTIFAESRVEEVLSVNIFDRWGNQVFQNYNFQPNDFRQGWDGKMSGEPMNPAVFVYMFRVLLDDGTEKVFSGDLTLVR